MDGKLLQLDGRHVLSFERNLNHPLEKVWRAITRPDQIAQWLTAQAELELTVDGQLTFRWDNGDLVHGKFTKIAPPYELEYTWIEQSAGHSVVRWYLREEGSGCHLQLTHTFYGTAVVLDFMAGWHVHLDVLDLVLLEQLREFPSERMKELREKYASHLNGNEAGE